MLISSNDNVATIVVVETNHCSADEEEVFSCLPMQQCMENNSVNSVKVCTKGVTYAIGYPLTIKC